MTSKRRPGRRCCLGTKVLVPTVLEPSDSLERSQIRDDGDPRSVLPALPGAPLTRLTACDSTFTTSSMLTTNNVMVRVRDGVVTGFGHLYSVEMYTIPMPPSVTWSMPGGDRQLEELDHRPDTVLVASGQSPDTPYP